MHERTRELVYAAAFALFVGDVARTSGELSELCFDMAHKYALKTADEAVKAMERAKEKETT